jgi:signal transduction histidine kinase
LQFNANKNKFFAINELETIVKNLQSNFPNAHIILPSSDVMIETNKNLFKTVMQNLIQNGLKFNQASLPKVTIEILHKTEYIQFLISDNGFGINAQFKEELFLPFKRFNKEIEGSGLGLTISKRIAQKMNGNLYCAKSDEKGTTFVLELPVTQ